MKPIINHIALIPDGNRRWARKKMLHPWIGHQAGLKAIDKIMQKARELEIPYFTFWGGSYDNLTKRPKREIKFLFKLYTEQFKQLLKDKKIRQDQVRVGVFGKWRKVLPRETQEAIEKVIKATKNYSQKFLTILLAYNGTDEMLDCIQKITALAQKKFSKITMDVIRQNLWTKELPPVDLVIRTGCENDPHISAGFMMWHTAYSQLYFTETLLPAFTPREFEKAIIDYSKRQRRLGA